MMKKDIFKTNKRTILKGTLTVGVTALAILGGGMLYHAAPASTPSISYACDYDSYYILPYSDSDYLTEEDLSGLDSHTLSLARNEIYARHGRRFNKESIQEYFDGQDWYYGTVSPSKFNEDVLNKYELANISLIKKVEERRKSTSSPVQKTSSSYIIAYSSDEYLSYSDIKGMSSDTLRKARNEIYARHGRRFKKKDLQTYFDEKTWYYGSIDPDDFDTNVLNKYEKVNIEFILQYE